MADGAILQRDSGAGGLEFFGSEHGSNKWPQNSDVHMELSIHTQALS
jgi:hypothetical protein